MIDITTLGLGVDSTQVVRARDELGRFTAAGNKAADSGTKMEGSWLKVKGVLAGLALGATIVELIKVADAMTLIDARLRLATGSAEGFAAAQKEIYRISQASNAGISETSQLFTKLYDPVKRAGGGIKETSAVVEAFAASLRVGGASAQEAASATLQFAQAMASGKLQGDEFKAISETSPRFLKAIADGMGEPIEKLKVMGSEGKLTADVLGNALIKQLGALKTEMKSMPDTVGGAMTRMANDFKLALNDINNASGATLGLAGSIEEARKLIPGLKEEALGAMEAIGDWIDANKTSMAEWWNEIKGLTGDLWEIVKVGGSIVGWITTATAETGAFTLVLQTARLLLGGLKDGVEFLGGAFATVGSLIMQVVVTPLTAAGKLAAEIVGAFDEDLGKAIRAEVDAIRSFAEQGARYGDEVAQRFADGKTNVAALSAEFEKHQQVADKTAQATQSQVRAIDAASSGYTTLTSAVAGTSKEKEKLAKIYADLRGSIEEQVAIIDQEMTLGRELNDAEKTRIEIASELTGKYKGLSEAQLNVIGRDLDAWEAKLKLRDATKEAADALRDYIKAQADEYTAVSGATTSAQEQLKLQRANIANMREQLTGGNKYRDHVNDLNVAVMRQKASQLALKASQMESNGEVTALSASLRAQAGAIAELADGMASMPGLKLLADIDAYLDPSKPQSFGEALREAFDGAGDSLVKMSSLLTDYTSKQEELTKMMKALAEDETISQEDRIKRETALIKKQGEIGADTFFSMAGAAKGFFKEGSDGYKVLHAAEAGWQAFQLASNLIKGLSAAKVAILNQAQGDPYTAFARMAAMAAAVAALGFAVSGGFAGGGSTGGDGAKQAEGTGTVFGDLDAKSESIENSIDMLSDTADLQLQTQTGMLSALRGIEAAIGGVTNLVLRQATEGDAASMFGIQEGKSAPKWADNFFTGGGSAPSLLMGKIWRGLFGSKTTITGTGLSAGPQSLGSIAEGGLNLQNYVDVNSTKKFFGIKVSNKNSTEYQAASSELSDQFTMIFKGFQDTVVLAGRELGQDLGVVEDRLKNFVVDIGKIDLTDLSGEEIQEKLSAVLGAAADDIARAGLPGLDDFRKVGEGYFETLVRVASGVETAKYQLEQLGIAAIGFGDIAAKQGDVGAEIVRQSIAGFETAGGVISSVGEIINTLDGSAEDLVETYRALVDVRDMMSEVGLGTSALTVELLRAAGGLDSFQSSLETYRDKFFSEEEKAAMGMTRLTESFAALNLSVPKTHAEFRALVEGLSKDASPASQELMAKVLTLAGVFDTATNATDRVAEAAAKAASSVKNVGDAMVTLANGSQMSMRAFAAKSAQVTDSDIRAGYGIPDWLKFGGATGLTREQWDGLSIPQANYAVGTSTWFGAAQNSLAMGTMGYDDPVPNYMVNSGSGGGDGAVDAMKDMTEALEDLRRTLDQKIDDLLTSEMSILSPEQRYEEAKRQFDTVASLASGGSKEAYGQLAGAADKLIELSRQTNASGSVFVADFSKVVRTLEAVRDGVTKLNDDTIDGIRNNADGLGAIERATAASTDTAARILDGVRLSAQKSVGFEQ